MDALEFVSGIKRKCCDSNAKLLEQRLKEKPPWREDPRVIAARYLFERLDEDDRAHFLGLLEYCAEGAIFSFFATLDGAAFIEDIGEKTVFKLIVSKMGTETLINNPHDEELHDIFNGLRGLESS